VLDAVFGQLAKHQGMSRWGDKTPEYTHNLHVIGELFPEAKYIHLVRDGRDVALSVMGRYWGPKNVYTAARSWKQAVCRVDRFVETLPPDRVLETTYERLLADPVDTFGRIIEYLDIDDCQGGLLDSIAENLRRDLMKTNYDKWRTRFSHKQRVQFESVACDVLQRHGYETMVDRVAEDPPALTKLYWICDNKLRKWTYLRYWQDNVYKISLRSTEALRAVGSRLANRQRRT